MKSILHQGHSGTELEDIISKCPTCLTYRNCKPNEIPSIPKIPGHPRTKCAAGIFCLHGHYYLILVDYYSMFIAASNLQNPQSETVIIKRKKVFSQFEIPNELITNNSPTF